MPRVFQKNLRRGRMADRIGLILLVALMVALLGSVLSGFSSLKVL